MSELKRMNRGTFLKTGGTAAVGGLLASSFPKLVFGKNVKIPQNVVFIICDQMRGDSLGCLGHPNARTPNLNKLAKEGILFENAFSNNPVCIPSRMSMFSGKYPHQHGHLCNKPKNLPKLSFKGTLAEHFKQRGYRLGWIGKNHTFENSVFSNFDTSSIRTREPFRKYNRFVPPHWHCDTLWEAEKCYPKKNTDEAINFINQAQSDEPFFLHISYFDPHPPYMAPAEYTSRYSSKEMKLPPYIPAKALGSRLDTFARAMRHHHLNDADLTETMRYYYAAIEWGVDHQVGRVIRALETKGILDNTVVVFTSDHGDFMGEHRMVRKGMFLHDALLHIPMIWYAPGLIAKGQRIKNLAQGVDIFPTLADVTGGKKPDGAVGRSLKPFLMGEKVDEKDFAVFASAGYSSVDLNIVDPSIDLTDKDNTPLHSRVLDQSGKPDYKTVMIRTNEWKLILNETEPPELYHMDGGWIERKNMAEKKEFASVRKSLGKKIETVWKWE